VPVPNDYCSFGEDGLGDGDGVVIGKKSCNVNGSCLFLGDKSSIGNRSCNSYRGCEANGLFGKGTIGDDSCNSAAVKLETVLAMTAK
jgi:hypothetical protein